MAELADDELLDLFRRFRRTGDRAVRNELIAHYRWLAVQAARRFEGRGEPLADLAQVAQLGLLKAVERFDPEHGAPFAAFAQPTVVGELRRYFRDATWSVRVPRRLKDLYVAVGPATQALTQQLGRRPTVDEIARHLACTEDEVLSALEASAGYRSSSLAALTDDDRTARDTSYLGLEDLGYDAAEARMMVERLMETLSERERTILHLRFFEHLSQEEISQKIGISQVHVSRLIRASLDRLRERVSSDSELTVDRKEVP